MKNYRIHDSVVSVLSYNRSKSKVAACEIESQKNKGKFNLVPSLHGRRSSSQKSGRRKTICEDWLCFSGTRPPADGNS